MHHSHANLLLANGVDLATISERLGTPPCARPPTFTRTPFAARTTLPPCVGTTSCGNPNEKSTGVN